MYRDSNENLIVQGPKLHAKISEDSIGLQIYNNLKRTDPNRILFVNGFTDETKTCGDFLKKTCELATCLKNYGLKRTDVVSICSENNLNFFEPVLAALYMGICIAPINHGYTEREILHVLNISKPKLIFCSNATYQKFLNVRSAATFIKKLIVFDLKQQQNNKEVENYETFIETFSSSSDIRNFRPIDLDTYNDLAVILCSSGTTGLPKGVMTTHRNINTRTAHFSDPRFHKITSDSVLFGILPFFHGFGFMTTLGNIYKLTKTVVVDRYVDRVFLKCIEKYKITNLWLVPPLVIFLAKSPMVNEYDLSSVVEIISGAAPLGKDVQDLVKKRFNIERIIQGYGLTETTLAVLQVPLESRDKIGSSGTVMPGIAIKIRDPETDITLGANQVGEICVKGDLVMKGYYENETATRNTFKDGWLLTGDLGYYDNDRYFFIVDRLKELIKYKGYQVPPAELEALLLKHPDVKDAGVIGIPDEEAGELAMAFVVKQNESSRVTEEDVQKFVAVQVSRPKQLHGGVRFVREIPKNASGKILRRVLKEMALQKKSKL